VAQTVDWSPAHLASTIRVAYEHAGTSFVRILQRCPHFTSHVFEEAIHDPSQVLLMQHERGIPLEPDVARRFPNQVTHDPHSLDEARSIAGREDVYPIGLFYRKEDAVRYDEITSQGLAKTQAEKLAAVEAALARFAI
jgi:2-oxoglutarate ferredoxin oxidoreductase subunit beta